MSRRMADDSDYDLDLEARFVSSPKEAAAILAPANNLCQPHSVTEQSVRAMTPFHPTESAEDATTALSFRGGFTVDSIPAKNFIMARLPAPVVEKRSLVPYHSAEEDWPEVPGALEEYIAARHRVVVLEDEVFGRLDEQRLHGNMRRAPLT